jgi:hypothetical protein
MSGKIKMKKLWFIDRSSVNLTLAFAMLLGIVAPAIAPMAVGASGLVTDRQMTLSNSGAGATGVDYELQFNAESDAGAVVVDFCNNSPIIGQTCTAPTGLVLTGATSSPSGVTVSGSSLFLTTSIDKDAPPTVITFSGITNPTSATTSSTGFYARVQTYVDGSDASTQHVSAAAPGTYIDGGGIAMAITNPIQVSAAVRETMTFCVSKVAPGPSCGKTGTAVTTPSLILGHGSPEALDSGATDTAGSYAQISTNASSGAVVNMKINNTCGGLKRTGAAGCDIAPSTTSSAITPGSSALFGLNVGTAATASGGTGSGTVTANAPYSTTSQYGMNWVSGNATGVGSTYGDKIFDTTGAPIDNQNIPLTFAATVTSTTPAGLYQANLSLVATGTY